MGGKFRFILDAEFPDFKINQFIKLTARPIVEEIPPEVLDPLEVKPENRIETTLFDFPDLLIKGSPYPSFLKAKEEGTLGNGKITLLIPSVPRCPNCDAEIYTSCLHATATEPIEEWTLKDLKIVDVKVEEGYGESPHIEIVWTYSDVTYKSLFSQG